MSVLTLLVVGTSIALQVAAVIMAVRTAMIVGRQAVWVVFAAFLLVAVLHGANQVFPIFGVRPVAASTPLITEVFGLLGSVLLVFGVKHVGALFKEHARVDRALRLSEERFRMLASAAQDAIVMTDTHGILVYWNPAATRMFGYTRSQAVGEPFHRLLLPTRLQARAVAYLETYRDTYKGAIAGRTLELTCSRKDGSEFVVECALSAMQVGGSRYALAIVRDVTERQAAKRRIESQLEDLRRFQRASVGRELRLRQVLEENRRLKAGPENGAPMGAKVGRPR
jgi:PAS domain S-box-containing protein